MASVVWDTFVNGGSMTRQHFVAVTSSQPARIANIGEHGQPLIPGNPANIAVFDPAKTWTIDGSSLRSKSMNTPWQGQRFTGQVRHTVCRGQLVVHEGVLTN
jgi:dihydroorotase